MSLIGFLKRRGGKAAVESPPVSEPATFEPLARSAFRALGVAAGASRREVADAAASVRLALKLGVRKSFDSDLAWLGHVAREESDVRDAVGRLSEPAQRAFERLFWFDAPPVALHVSNVEELERAVSSLSSREADAPHDAALLALAGLTRLDPELNAADAWARAFELWRRVFESDDFWSRLVASDLRGDFEQLVTYAEVRELRAGAPRVVSRALAERARDAAVLMDARECGRALALLRGAELPRALLDEYEREALGPLEDALTERVDTAFAWLPFVTREISGAATARNYANAAWRRFRFIRRELAEFASAAGASHYAARRLFEHAASKLLQLSERFDSLGRSEESLFVALKSRALAPPGAEAREKAEARLRALGADEAIRVETEDEYVAALARELADAREPAKLFKDDKKGEATIDRFINAFAGEGNSFVAPRRNTGFLPALLMCLGFAFTCFALQFFGVIKTSPSRTYPRGVPMPTYTPFQLNLNYNYNLNLNIRPYPIPTPLTLDEPRKSRSTRKDKRSKRRDSPTRVGNDNALLLPPPAP